MSISPLKERVASITDTRNFVPVGEVNSPVFSSLKNVLITLYAFTLIISINLIFLWLYIVLIMTISVCFSNNSFTILANCWIEIVRYTTINSFISTYFSKFISLALPIFDQQELYHILLSKNFNQIKKLNNYLKLTARNMAFFTNHSI